MVGVVDRLVVDSREWTDVRADFARLPALFDRVAVSDIAWARTLPWRAGVAELWPDVAEAAVIRVAGPEPEALLLQGWLSTRLGRDVRLEHEPAGEVELVEVDGREARTGRARAEDVERPALGRARGLRARPGLRGGRTELLAGPDLAGLAAGWIADRSRGTEPVPHRADRRLDAARRLRAARGAGARLALVARVVERRAAGPARPPRLERAPGPRGAALPRRDPGEPDPSAAVARRPASGLVRPRAPRRRPTTATRPRSTPATTRSSPIPARSSTSRCRACRRCIPGSRSRSRT